MDFEIVLRPPLVELQAQVVLVFHERVVGMGASGLDDDAVVRVSKFFFDSKSKSRQRVQSRAVFHACVCTRGN